MRYVLCHPGVLIGVRYNHSITLHMFLLWQPQGMHASWFCILHHPAIPFFFDEWHVAHISGHNKSLVMTLFHRFTGSFLSRCQGVHKSWSASGASALGKYPADPNSSPHHLAKLDKLGQLVFKIKITNAFFLHELILLRLGNLCLPFYLCLTFFTHLDSHPMKLFVWLLLGPLTGKQLIWGEHPGTSFWSLAIHQCHPGNAEGTGATPQGKTPGWNSWWIWSAFAAVMTTYSQKGAVVEGSSCYRKGPNLVKEASSCWGQVGHTFH